MTKVPQARGREVIRALKKHGFFIHHQKESHVTLRHKKDVTKRVTVPVHGGKTVKKGTLRDIIKDAGLTVEQFKKLL